MYDHLQECEENAQYPDHADQYIEQRVINPCSEIPTPELAYRDQHFNQHGQGENP